MFKVSADIFLFSSSSFFPFLAPVVLRLKTKQKTKQTKNKKTKLFFVTVTFNNLYRCN